MADEVVAAVGAAKNINSMGVKGDKPQMRLMAAPSWNCYLLVTGIGTKQKTYVGVTPDLDRRLRQHNGEIRGGAAATAGRSWERVCHVRGFPDHRAALQFEWRWKQISRKYFAAVKSPLERRLKALQELLALDRPTTAAAPYSSWPVPPEVVWESGHEMPTL